eukprot:4845522-Lingulodinium_polyedra.AAC.1
MHLCARASTRTLTAHGDNLFCIGATKQSTGAEGDSETAQSATFTSAPGTRKARERARRHGLRRR